LALLKRRCCRRSWPRSTWREPRPRCSPCAGGRLNVLWRNWQLPEWRCRGPLWQETVSCQQQCVRLSTSSSMRLRRQRLFWESRQHHLRLRLGRSHPARRSGQRLLWESRQHHLRLRLGRGHPARRPGQRLFWESRQHHLRLRLGRCRPARRLGNATGWKISSSFFGSTAPY
jgi:hypothetical protein